MIERVAHGRAVGTVVLERILLIYGQGDERGGGAVPATAFWSASRAGFPHSLR